jgi:hypothetical protein
MKPEKAKKTVYVQLKKERKKLEIIESRSKGSEKNVSIKKREKSTKNGWTCGGEQEREIYATGMWNVLYIRSLVYNTQATRDKKDSTPSTKTRCEDQETRHIKVVGAVPQRGVDMRLENMG